MQDIDPIACRQIAPCSGPLPHRAATGLAPRLLAVVAVALLATACSADSFTPSMKAPPPAGVTPAAEPAKAAQPAPVAQPAKAAQPAPAATTRKLAPLLGAAPTPQLPPLSKGVPFVPTPVQPEEPVVAAEVGDAPTAGAKRRAYRLRGKTPAETGPPPGASPMAQRIWSLRKEHQDLRTAIVVRDERFDAIRQAIYGHTQNYNASIGAVAAKIEGGSRPNDPLLSSQLNRARAELDRLQAEISDLRALGGEASIERTAAARLKDQAQALIATPGATKDEETDRQALAEEIQRSGVSVDLLINGVAIEVARQNALAERAEATYQALSQGIPAEPFVDTMGIEQSPLPAMPSPEEGRKPLTVIRFDRPNVQYAEALHRAMSEALRQRPESRFDLVVVTASGGGPAKAAANRQAAKDYAESVLTSLGESGLPVDRVAISGITSPAITDNEIKLFAR